jgi:hypothetical protein
MRQLPRLRLALLACILFACGCKSNNEGKIEGTKWSSISSYVKGIHCPAGTLRLEFTTDGKLVYKAGPVTYTGKYSLGMGDTVTLHLDRDLAGRKNHAEKVTISGNQLSMTDSDGTSMTFNKVK